MGILNEKRCNIFLKISKLKLSSFKYINIYWNIKIFKYRYNHYKY